MTIKTLIVDDTVIYRKILSEVIVQIPAAEVVATAPNGSIALSKADTLDIDLILLDQVMPEMNGIECLRRLKEKHPEIQVIMVSGVSEEAAQSTMEALNLGALDFIRKPSGNNLQSNVAQLLDELTPLFRTLELKKSRVTKSARGTPEPTAASNKSTSTHFRLAPVPHFFQIVAIGVSTGGPNALNEVIPKLPLDFPLPIVMVQHMPPTFTAALAEDLNKKSKVTVTEAEEGMEIKPGTVYIAKGGCHMVVRRQSGLPIIRLTEGPPENSCRPAVDVLFRSVADAFGGNGILGVIMTGMGSDGMAGVKAMKRKGCYCLTQSKDTCVVYGMPRAVDEAGLSDRQVPLNQLAGAIDNISRGIK